MFGGLTRRSVLQGMAATGFVTTAGSRAWGSPLRWDLTIYYGPGHSLTQQYMLFTDALRERTGGELDVTVRTAGELPFRATEAVTILGQRQVDMALGYQGFIAGTTKVAALTGLPFLIRNEDEANRALPALVPFVEAKMAEQGVKPLIWSGQNWPQNAYGRGTPIRRLEDFQGRNARGSSPEQGDIIQRYGGAPVTLTTAEVPEAMHRGVVDAVFTGAANITGSHWTEFLEWAYLCDPHIAIEYVMINNDSYAELSAEMRDILDTTSAEFRASINEARRASNDEALAQLRTELEVIDAAPEDIERYNADWAGYWTEWAGDDPHVQAALAAVREAVGK